MSEWGQWCPATSPRGGCGVAGAELESQDPRQARSWPASGVLVARVLLPSAPGETGSAPLHDQSVPIRTEQTIVSSQVRVSGQCHLR